MVLRGVRQPRQGRTALPQNPRGPRGVTTPVTRTCLSGTPISPTTIGFRTPPQDRSGKCLDVAGNSTANGAWIVQCDCGYFYNEWVYADTG